MPLDFLFRRGETRRTQWREQRELREPILELPRLIPAPAPERPPLPEPVKPGAQPPETEIRVREMSPRQMADWAHEMYMTGWISWDDYRAAMPPELDPNYDTTVGALTGEKAEPDRPRDMVREWEERLEFAARHFRNDPRQIKPIERIVSILRWQAGPEDLAA